LFRIPYFAILLEHAPSAKVALRSLAGRAPVHRLKDAANSPPAICVSICLSAQSTASGRDNKEKKNNNNGTASADHGSCPMPARSAGVFTVKALQKVLDKAAAAPSSTAKGSLGSMVWVVETEHKLQQAHLAAPDNTICRSCPRGRIPQNNKLRINRE